jgi:hypothetical protein
MKLKFNFQKFCFLMLILNMAIFAGGCTAAWLTAVSGLLPGILAVVNAAVSFIFALEGKTVPAGLTAAFQKWQQNIATEIQNVQALIADFKKSSSTGLLSQIEAVMQGIVSQLTGILSGLGITDNATVSKITQLVGLAVAAAQAIVALIPVAISKMNSGLSRAELEREDRIAANVVETTLKTMKDTYVAIVTEPTTNADVNAALSSLPQSI